MHGLREQALRTEGDPPVRVPDEFSFLSWEREWQGRMVRRKEHARPIHPVAVGLLGRILALPCTMHSQTMIHLILAALLLIGRHPLLLLQLSRVLSRC